MPVEFLKYAGTNATFFSLLLFALGFVLSGLMFARIDAEPAEKVGITVTTVQMGISIGMFMGAFLIFLTNPFGPALSTWLATLIGFFAAVWYVLSNTLSKGGDLKPIAWMLLYIVILLVAYAIMIAASPQMRPFSGLYLDAFILLLLAALACAVGWVGILWTPGLLRLTGIIFVVTGAYGLYFCIRYLFATVGVGSF